MRGHPCAHVVVKWLNCVDQVSPVQGTWWKRKRFVCFHLSFNNNIMLQFLDTPNYPLWFWATTNNSQIWSYFSLLELRGRTSHCSDPNMFCMSFSHKSCKYRQGMTLSKNRSQHKIWQKLSVGVLHFPQERWVACFLTEMQIYLDHQVFAVFSCLLLKLVVLQISDALV